MSAADNGRANEVPILLEQGADPNYADSESRDTPLTFAAHKGHADCVRLLVASGADKEAKNEVE